MVVIAKIIGINQERITGETRMKQYESYQIDNDMWYKKRKHIYHLMGIYDGGHCACIIATYSLKTKTLLIKGANEHIPESKILKQFVEYAESKGFKEEQE